MRVALRTTDPGAPRHKTGRPAPRERRAELDLIGRFVERLGDYRATVHRSTEASAAEVVTAALADLTPAQVGVPVGLEPAWRPQFGAVHVESLDLAALGKIEAVVTACHLAIAETGTIVLDHGPDQGPRRATLLPDRHVCLVRAGQIVDHVGHAFAALDVAARAGEPARPVTLVSGPSATSDIELVRVEGVHGPRSLTVVVLEP